MIVSVVMVVLVMGAAARDTISSQEWTSLEIPTQDHTTITPLLPFNPSTTLLEYRLTRLSTTAVLNFYLKTYLFREDSGLAVGTVQIYYDTKSSWIEISGSSEKDSCYDHTVLDNRLPRHVSWDLTTQHVATIDGVATAEFNTCKNYNQYWRSLIDSGTVTGAKIELYNSNKETELAEYLRVQYRFIAKTDCTEGNASWEYSGVTAKIQLPVANGTVIPVKCQGKGSINHGLTTVSCLGNNHYSRLRADCHTLELGRNTNLVSGLTSVPAKLRDMDASTCEMIDSLGKEGIRIGTVCPGGYCKVDYILLFGSPRFNAVAGKRRDGVWKYFYSTDLHVADNNITMPEGSAFQMINIHFPRSQRVCEVVIAGRSVTDVGPEPQKPKPGVSLSASGSGTESFLQNTSAKDQIKLLFDWHITAKNYIKTSEKLRLITQNKSHLFTADDVQRTSLIIQRLVDFSEEELVAEVADNILKTINSVHSDTRQSEFAEGNTASEMRKSVEMFCEKMAKGLTDSYQSESTVSVAVKHYRGGSTTDFSITGSANSIKNTKFAGFEESSSHLFAASVPDNGRGRAVRAIFYDSTKFYPAKSTDDLENMLHDGRLGKPTMKKIASLVTEISYSYSPKTVKLQGDKRLKMQFTVKDPAVHFMTKYTSNYTCVYYDTDTKDWKDSGCETTIRNKRVHCSCNHMTSFAILMSISSESDPMESKVSKILLGVSLSCLICTIIAYLPAKKLVKTRTVRLNLLLVTSLILAIVTFYFMEVVAKSSSGQEDLASWGCNVVAFLMNYFWLCQMAWMVVEAVVMYRALVSCVLNSYIHRYMLKFNLACWGVPMVFPTIGLCWGGARFANPRTCFLQAPYGYLTFYSPMAACVVFNTAIFIRITGSLFRRKKVSMGSGKDVMQLVREFKSAVLAMSLFGVTWMFGFFLVFEQVNNTWLRYIFIALNSTQGIWIFVLYVLLKEDLKKVWKRLLGLAGPESYSLSHIPTSSSKVSKVGQPLVPEGIVAERVAMLYSVSTNSLDVTAKPNTARSTRNSLQVTVTPNTARSTRNRAD